jgi:hypothetical protein
VSYRHEIRLPASPSCWTTPVAAGVVLGANRAIASNPPLVGRAILDELAHLATTVLALQATQQRDRRFLATALGASVLVDLDHVPDRILGWRGLTAGSPRPYTHSLTSIAAVVAASALTAPTRRHRLDGLGFGLAMHFLRDATDGSGGLPLLWPLSRSGIKLPAWLQPLMALAAVCWIARGSKRRPPTLARASQLTTAR